MTFAVQGKRGVDNGGIGQPERGCPIRAVGTDGHRSREFEEVGGHPRFLLQLTARCLSRCLSSFDHSSRDNPAPPPVADKKDVLEGAVKGPDVGGKRGHGAVARVLQPHSCVVELELRETGVDDGRVQCVRTRGVRGHRSRLERAGLPMTSCTLDATNR